MAKHKLIKKQVSIQDRSERNRVDRKNMIQECKNPIVEDDSHGFLHRNCEDTEQLRKQFYHTVHTVNAQDDTEGQLTVWADGKADLFYYGELHINFAQNNELAFPNNLVSLMKLRLTEKKR